MADQSLADEITRIRIERGEYFYCAEDLAAYEKEHGNTGKARIMKEFEHSTPRVCSNGELQSTSEDGFDDSEEWVSCEATLALDGSDSALNSVSDKKDPYTAGEIKSPGLPPKTPKIKPIDELKTVGSVDPLDFEDRIWLSSPVMLAGAVSRAFLPSVSNSKDFCSADVRASQEHGTATPEILSEDGRFPLLKSLPPQRQVRKLESVVTFSDSDVESLNLSEPGSDAESWIHEPTTAELEEQLQEKSELAGKLFLKLQKSETQLEGLRLHCEKQLQGACETHLSIAAREKQPGKTDEVAFEHAITKQLAAYKARYDGLLHATEERRRNELAAAENRIQKYKEDLTAERNSLIAELESKYTALSDKYTRLQYGPQSMPHVQSELAMLQQIKIPALQGQAAGLQQLVANLQASTANERSAHRAELSELSRQHRYTLVRLDQFKASARHSQIELTTLQKIKLPALHDQAAALQHLLAAATAAHTKDTDSRTALVAKFATLSTVHTHLAARHAALQTAHARLERAHEIAQAAHKVLEKRLLGGGGGGQDATTTTTTTTRSVVCEGKTCKGCDWTHSVAREGEGEKEWWW